MIILPFSTAKKLKPISFDTSSSEKENNQNNIEVSETSNQESSQHGKKCSAKGFSAKVYDTSKGVHCNEYNGFIEFNGVWQIENKRTGHQCKICDKTLHGLCSETDGKCEIYRICKGYCYQQWLQKQKTIED